MDGVTPGFEVAPGLLRNVANVLRGSGAGTVLGRRNHYDSAGNALVFSFNGDAVYAADVVPDILVTGGKIEWGTMTRLEPRGNRAPAVLALVEP